MLVRPWVRKIPWRRKGQPAPVFLPGESIPWTEEPGGLQSMGSQSQTRLEQLTHTHTHTHIHTHTHTLQKIKYESLENGIIYDWEANLLNDLETSKILTGKRQGIKCDKAMEEENHLIYVLKELQLFGFPNQKLIHRKNMKITISKHGPQGLLRLKSQALTGGCEVTASLAHPLGSSSSQNLPMK